MMNIETLIREDAKRKFRISHRLKMKVMILYETGESYGTPHDLASLYGKDRM